MVKLIFMDLDDTLFGADRTVSPYARSVLQRARARGVLLACSTARGVMAKRKIPWELFEGGVFASGAIVELRGKRIYDRTIPPDVVLKMMRDIHAMGVRVGAEVEETHYANFRLSTIWPEFETCILTDFERLPGGAGKLYAVFDDPEQRRAFTATLPPEYYLRVNRDNLTMVNHREADKGIGVRILAEAMGIDLADTAAFGDDVTDVAMLRACGIGVAMANAIDEVKVAADLVCPDHREDGVARTIEAWLEEGMV